MRAGSRYKERYGDHYAAAITYFSVLALVPLLMIAFAIAGSFLAGRPDLITDLQQSIMDAVPGALGDTVNSLVSTVIEERSKVGVVGLAVALYAGWNWMVNIRDALTAQWAQERPELPFLRTALRDLLALLGLGLAIAASIGLTISGTALGGLILRAVGLDDAGWAPAVLGTLTVVLSVAANWLVFLWVLAKLPRRPVPLSAAVLGALAAAIGIELLKQVGDIYFTALSKSPSAAVFGSFLGLLVLIYLVARFLLFVTAWTATARESQVEEPVPAPGPAVIRPIVEVRSSPAPKVIAGLVTAGAALGVILTKVRRRS